MALEFQIYDYSEGHDEVEAEEDVKYNQLVIILFMYLDEQKMINLYMLKLLILHHIFILSCLLIGNQIVKLKLKEN
jgi:hypothetical protein